MAYPTWSPAGETKYIVCNIHAGGKEYIKDVLSKRTSLALDKEFVVAGDFNQEPSELLKWKEISTFTVVSAGKETRPDSKRELDYAVSTTKGSAKLTPHYGASDHIAVVLDFDESVPMEE